MSSIKKSTFIMYKFLFGPVPSRRLGISLGVDLVPHKVCSLNCVYCECGKTTKLTNERMEYVPVDKVLKELDHFFKNNPDPDYITFSGAGEPTLNSGLGKVLDIIKRRKPDIPVAVLTNGTLLNDAGVRKELMKADVILPSLDSALDDTFQKINRPYHELKTDKIINGLVDFRKEFKGKIWLEVFILPGYNDDTRNLDALKQAILRIKPDLVQLNTLDRPGTVEDLKPMTKSGLQKIIEYWQLDNVEIIASAPERKDIISYRKDTETAILETISRRPCTIEDMAKTLGMHVNEINKYLGVLENENKIESKKLERGVFYMINKD